VAPPSTNFPSGDHHPHGRHHRIRQRHQGWRIEFMITGDRELRSGPGSLCAAVDSCPYRCTWLSSSPWLAIGSHGRRLSTVSTPPASGDISAPRRRQTGETEQAEVDDNTIATPHQGESRCLAGHNVEPDGRSDLRLAGGPPPIAGRDSRRLPPPPEKMMSVRPGQFEARARWQRRTTTAIPGPGRSRRTPLGDGRVIIFATATPWDSPGALDPLGRATVPARS
jgi:hypothetical protein